MCQIKTISILKLTNRFNQIKNISILKLTNRFNGLRRGGSFVFLEVAHSSENVIFLSLYKLRRPRVTYLSTSPIWESCLQIQGCTTKFS